MTNKPYLNKFLTFLLFFYDKLQAYVNHKGDFEMKKLYSILLITAALGLGTQAIANEQTTKNNLKSNPQNILLAANCASNCSSCWDQCTSSDNCGVGFNCATTPCGNRCIKQ